jgi:dipeptidyl aminopeptidase/acylaminoacyl peptidase
MKKIIILTVLLLIGGYFIMTEFKNPKTIPMEDFFKNPETSNYKISPDGNTISYLDSYKDRMNLYIMDKNFKNKKRLTSVTDRDINSYFWKTNDYIIYARDFKGDENFHLFSINLKTNEIKDLTPFEDTRAGVLDDLEDISNNEILIELNKRNKEVFDVYRLNIETGKMTMVEENPGNITGWLTDHNGKIKLASTTDGLIDSIFYRENENEKFKKIITTDFKDTFSPLFFTFDNKNLYLETNIGRDKTAFIKYDPRKKEELELIYENDKVDMGSLSYSKKRKKITAASYHTWKKQRVFFDDKTKKIIKNLESKLPELEISITSHDKEEETFIVRTYSDKTLGAYYIYDFKNDDLKKIGELSPWLDASNMADTKPISFKSRDGLTIHGYLIIPKGKEAKNLPVVVNPHGGPWHRDYWGFDKEAQFLANRGYAVLKINFRGSTGYGRAFWVKGFKQWGKDMQDDITDGVKWIINEGIANPKKIAIYGGSYGGYATLAGLTFTPDLYACGVDYVGVSNLFTFMNSIPPYWKPFLKKMQEMVGDPIKDKKLLREASPVFHVDKIKVPLFVAQGAKDPRVNINESDQIVEALKKRGIKVPYLVKENEGHGFRNEENRFDFYRKMESFLKDCLK